MSLPSFHLSGSYRDSDCPISLLEYKPFNLDNYIKLNDYIEFIAENKERVPEELNYIQNGVTRLPKSTGYYNHTNTNVFPIEKNNDYQLLYPSSFLVTDIVSPDVQKLPLFYEHRFQYDFYSEVRDPKDKIKLWSNGKNQIDERTYIVEYANATLTDSGNINRTDLSWSRIKPAGKYFRCRILLPYDPNLDRYYEVEYDAYIQDTINKRKELVNRKPIYLEGYHYNITSSGVSLVSSVNDEMDGSGLLYAQKNYNSRIFLKPFDEKLNPTSRSNWNLTFNPGIFIEQSGFFNDNNITYSLPRNDNYVGILQEQPEKITQNIVKLTKFPLYVASSGYPSYQVVSGINFWVNDELMDNSYIQSIDYEKGFVKFKRDLVDSDTVLSNYVINTKENYTINNFDLNPKNNTVRNFQESFDYYTHVSELGLYWNFLYFSKGAGYSGFFKPGYIGNSLKSIDTVGSKGIYFDKNLVKSNEVDVEFYHKHYGTQGMVDGAPNMFSESTELLDTKIESGNYQVISSSGTFTIKALASGWNKLNILVNCDTDESEFWVDNVYYGKYGLKSSVDFVDRVRFRSHTDLTEEYELDEMQIKYKPLYSPDFVDNGLSLALAPSGGYPSGIVLYNTTDNTDGDFANDTYGYPASSGDMLLNSGLLDANTKLIGDLTYKHIPKDIITTTDIRRLGGGLHKDKKSQEDDWYYDFGKWDGEILQSNSAVAIQIPSGIQNYFIDKFYDNGTFTTENYNEQILLGVDPSSVLSSVSFDDLKYFNAVREANKYITDCIERYLPAGTEYVILDENYNLWDILI